MNRVISESLNNNYQADDQRLSEDDDAESITELANRTIVIHPGSFNLRIGRAWDRQPHCVPHVVAWRRKGLEYQRDENINFLKQSNKVNVEKSEEDIKELLQSPTLRTRKVDQEVKPESLPQAKQLVGEASKWTDTSSDPQSFVGKEALYLKDSECYDLFWPIKNGQLNLRHKSLQGVLADLQIIWEKEIEKLFKIPKTEIPKYRCILLVPDIFNRSHVKYLISMLLIDMGFISTIVHQESVCATYGCGVGAACVIDIGHEKTSVCCVDDGLSLEDTRITFNVGGEDITNTFYHLLLKNEFPYKDCDPNHRMDWLLLEKLKKTHCTLDVEATFSREEKFLLERPDQHKDEYSISFGKETLQAPLSLFHLNSLDEDFGLRFATANPGDNEDPHDEYYLLSTRPKHTEALVCKKSQKISEKSANKFATKKLMKLEEAILWSINNCPDSMENETKKRMLSCLLLVGGGLANFQRVRDILTHKIKMCLGEDQFENFQSDVDIRVINRPKDLDPSIIAWKGGSVMSCLDTAQELWIDQQEWKNHGLRILRERCAFVW